MSDIDSCYALFTLLPPLAGFFPLQESVDLVQPWWWFLESIRWNVIKTIQNELKNTAVLKLSGQTKADSKTVPGLKSCLRFSGVIGQNKIKRTFTSVK